MTAVRVWGPNLSNAARAGAAFASFHVHSANCTDNRHYGPGGVFGGEGTTNPESYPTLKALVQDYYSDIINESEHASWADYEDDFKVYPCVHWDGKP